MFAAKKLRPSAAVDALSTESPLSKHHHDGPNGKSSDKVMILQPVKVNPGIVLFPINSP